MPSLSRTPRARGLTWAALTLAWLTVLALTPTHSVRAQDANKGDAPAAKAAPAAAAAGGEAEKPVARKSMLMWALEASGPIGVFILILSIYFTALVIRLFLEFRLSEAVPTELVEKLDTSIKEKKFQETYDVCRDDNSFLARLVRTGIANLPNGRPEAKEAMNAVAEELVVGMESKISYLATIGTLGPMIGLVGTIWGMIQAFQELATAGGQPRPEKLAAGISTALFITLEGVSLSVPAIFFFAFFRNRIAQISTEATKVADRTINAFYTAAKQVKSPVAAGP
ncbi:MAG TPA: MotA/TolQ/ExbB proton channel family protein [Isosphaeraceae bacterium]|jgi:biopolymer transport protein ExbB|nr:MotA/TolQ/ExbB proton channel family protein [Isosphaeraceae bacterium]